MNKRILGVVIFLVIVGGALVWRFVIEPNGVGNFSGDIITLKGFIGSEKANFLDNPRVQDLLRRNYGIEIEYRKAGSVEMMSMDYSDQDFLWPSSKLAEEYFSYLGGTSRGSSIAFNSPIVMYSWRETTDALVAQGLATRRDDVYYLDGFPELVAMAGDPDGASWSDLGLDFLLGRVTISSTDPNRSNSGNMFAGLVANVLADDIVDMETLPQVQDAVVEIFRRQGLMEHSTGTLFERYLTLGQGTFPLVVGYENGLLEFSLGQPELFEDYKSEMRILYPVPTVYSEHPIIALNEPGRRLIEAMEDPEILDLAWTQHGFRTGIQNDPADLGFEGLIPRSVTAVTRTPSPEVMQELMEAIGN